MVRYPVREVQDVVQLMIVITNGAEQVAVVGDNSEKYVEM